MHNYEQQKSNLADPTIFFKSPLSKGNKIHRENVGISGC